MISEDKVQNISKLFKIISDPTRIKILYVLEKGPMTVGRLTETLQMIQSTVSHQLRILKDHHLVTSKRNGNEMIYSLTDDHVHIIFNQASEHIQEN